MDHLLLCNTIWTTLVLKDSSHQATQTSAYDSKSSELLCAPKGAPLIYNFFQEMN